MPKYSFVIPVYNCRQYLEECVSSVLDQTVSDLEILLVDDGSADGSGELCDKLAERDERIRVYHKENGGAGSARNLGIEKSEGDYVLFIDGDDTIEKDCLESVEPALSGEACLPVFGMSFDYWKDEKPIRHETQSVAFPGSHTVLEVAKEFYAFFEDNVLSSACNKVFPVKILSENGLRFPESMPLYEDLAFVLNCLPHFERIFVIEKGIYHYRNIIGKKHIDRRVSDLSALRENLIPLNHAFREFGERTGERVNAASVSANLYLMLLECNLLISGKNSVPKLDELTSYASEESFRAALDAGAKLDPEKQRLLTLIEKGDRGAIKRIYSGKKLKSAIKRTVKRLLGR